jgi:acetyl esterase/lipase
MKRNLLFILPLLLAAASGLSACQRLRARFPAETPTTATTSPAPSNAPTEIPATLTLSNPPVMLTDTDIPYAEIEGVQPTLLSLDVYSPQGCLQCPVMVMVHGGGWRTGDKANADVAAAKSQYFVSQGYIFVSINYRLTPAVMHPVHAQDVAASLAWIHANIPAYGGDPGRMFLMGHSAGAHLAALVATDGGYLAAHGLGLDILDGVILLDGAGYDIPYVMQDQSEALQWLYREAFGDDPQTWQDASPLYHVAAGKDIPPFLLFHAGEREASRFTGQEMTDALTAAGVEAWLVPAPDKDHGTINGDIGLEGDWVTERIMEFLSGLVNIQP